MTRYTIVTNDEYEIPVKCDATAQECAEYIGTTPGNVRNMVVKPRKKSKYKVIVSIKTKFDRRKWNRNYDRSAKRKKYFHDRYMAIKNGTWKAAAMVLAVAIMVAPVTVRAKEPELNKSWLTCYLPTGRPTASGVMPRRGIMAGKREWLGKTALIYERDGDKVGDLIGIYEVLDTGVGYDNAIIEGRAVDVFCETEADIIPTQKIWVQIVDADG